MRHTYHFHAVTAKWTVSGSGSSSKLQFSGQVAGAANYAIDQRYQTGPAAPWHGGTRRIEATHSAK